MHVFAISSKSLKEPCPFINLPSYSYVTHRDTASQNTDAFNAVFRSYAWDSNRTISIAIEVIEVSFFKCRRNLAHGSPFYSLYFHVGKEDGSESDFYSALVSFSAFTEIK